MKRLNLYITATHASVTVQNGVSRETSAPSVSEMIDGMPEQDRATLNGFCKAVAEYIDNSDVRSRASLSKLVTTEGGR